VEVSEGVLYVFGGGTPKHDFVETIECYTKLANSWEIIQTNMPISPRLELGAITINIGKYVMIFGGFDDWGKHKDVLILHTDSNHLELLNKDTKLEAIPSQYPLAYD